MVTSTEYNIIFINQELDVRVSGMVSYYVGSTDSSPRLFAGLRAGISLDLL